MEGRIPPIDTARLTRSLTALLRRTAVKILLPLLTGFALARTGIPGGIYPFAAAFAAAVPQGSVAAGMAGVLLGFILPGNDAETLRCAASALAVAGIKWALAELRPVRESPFLPMRLLSFTPFLPVSFLSAAWMRRPPPVLPG